MEYPSDWQMRMRRPVESVEMELRGHGRMEVQFEIARLAYVHFSHAILASAVIEGIKIVLGWVGFYEGWHGVLGKALPDGIELRETKTDPDFFGCGIGTQLVRVAQIFVSEQGKALYLKPERPGQGLAKEYRDREFPMDDAQIRAFYLRHGFRDLTALERFQFSARILDADITTELNHAGFDPTTQMFGPHRYSMDPVDPVAIAVREIPTVEKLRWLRAHFEQEKRTTYRDAPHYQPDRLIVHRIQGAVQSTRGILLMREDLPLPKKFKPGYRVFYGPKPHPPMLGAGSHI